MNSIKGLNTIDRTRFRSLEVEEPSKTQVTQRPPPPSNDQSSFDSGEAPKGPPPFPGAAADALGLSAERSVKGHKGHHHPPPSLDALADNLGLSTEDLQAQLQAGTSVQDIATAQGVTLDAPKPFRINDMRIAMLEP